MLVKVNTVLIPGINDHHIAQVSEKVKSLGATLHNIMPLISDPSHGTYFGLSGQRGPTEDELQRVREECGVHMPQMTHCKQCRADAVGMLSDDKASTCGSSSKPSVYKVAVASHGEAHIGLHFGHAKRFESTNMTNNHSNSFLRNHVTLLNTAQAKVNVVKSLKKKPCSTQSQIAKWFSVRESESHRGVN